MVQTSRQQTHDKFYHFGMSVGDQLREVQDERASAEAMMKIQQILYASKYPNTQASFQQPQLQSSLMQQVQSHQPPIDQSPMNTTSTSFQMTDITKYYETLE